MIVALLFLLLTGEFNSYTYSDYNLSALKHSRGDPYLVSIPETNATLLFNVYDIITSYYGTSVQLDDCTALTGALGLFKCEGINTTEQTNFSEDGQSFVATCLISFIP